MNHERVARRLADLTQIAAEAEHLVSKGWEAYVADTMDGALLRNAGERILIKAATVAEKLPEEFKGQGLTIDKFRI